MICIAAVSPVSHSPKVAVPSAARDIRPRPEAAPSEAMYQQWHETAWTAPTTPPVPGAAGSSRDPPLRHPQRASALPGAAPPGAAPPGTAPPGAAGSSQDTPLCPQVHAAAPPGAAPPGAAPPGAAPPGAAGSSQDTPLCPQVHAAAPPGAAPPGAAPPDAAPPGAAPLDEVFLQRILRAEGDTLLAMFRPLTAHSQLEVVQYMAMSNEWETVLDLVERFDTICAEQAGLLSMAAVMAWRCSPLEICVSVFGCCLLFVQLQHLASISPLPRHYLFISPLFSQYLTIISPLTIIN